MLDTALTKECYVNVQAVIEPEVPCLYSIYNILIPSAHFPAWTTSAPTRLQFLHSYLILHQELLPASLCAWNIVRRRLPVRARSPVHEVDARTVLVVRRGQLERTAHVHDLSVIGRVSLPRSRVFVVRVHVACEVDDGVLEEFREGGVDRGDEWRGGVVLLREL